MSATRARNHREPGRGRQPGSRQVRGSSGLRTEQRADLTQPGGVLAGVVLAEQELVAGREQGPHLRRGPASVATVLTGEDVDGVDGVHIVCSAGHCEPAGELVAEMLASHDQHAVRTAGDPATSGGTESGVLTVAEGGACVIIVGLLRSSSTAAAEGSVTEDPGCHPVALP